MTELELLVDFHKDAERQGPGSKAETLRALSLMNIDTRKNLKVADIGCGTGAQTIILAQNIGGQITAVDLFPEFLEKLDFNSKEQGLQDKIITRKMSMEALSFQDKEFDIIWSEGAIYNIGFEAGVKQWKKYLKSNGYIAVSEITWTTNSRPAEIEEHWKNEYPEIDTASNKIKILEENGYTPVGYFTLPKECWIDNYYNPMENRFIEFLSKHNYSDIAKNLVETEKEEIRKYLKYKDYLSYGFYIAQNIEQYKQI
jgi:ubiquinone/menaquinone biosynthesis C-methylase UbiE